MFDVIVVGAGEAGIGAAIQSLREGLRVLLIESTDWVGGMMAAAGVTSMDGNDGWLASGLYAEFIKRVEDFYKKQGRSSIGTCYFHDYERCFEPHVGREIVHDMLYDAAEIGYLDFRVRESIDAVVVNQEGRIVGIQTVNGEIFQGKFVIDATEYGDVIASSPAEYRVGNSTSDHLTPAACVSSITYSAVLKRYPGELPKGLRLVVEPPGYRDAREYFDSKLQVGGSAWFRDGAVQYPINWTFHNAYRGMPDSANPDKGYTAVEKDAHRITKTGVNWFNDITYTVGDLDRDSRQVANCKAKLYTLNFIYYVQNELGEYQWSVANDEGYDTQFNLEGNRCESIPDVFADVEKYFPVQPYVRESRRLVGVYTLTGSDIKRVGESPNFHAERFFSTSLALGSYSVDLHGCGAPETLESDLEDVSAFADFIGKRGPFQIPYESFIPARVGGLIAAGKTLSVSRIANGATRHQPISMLTGQAAGAIAAVAIKTGAEPMGFSLGDVARVQEVLLRNKSMLVPVRDVDAESKYYLPVQFVVLNAIMRVDEEFRFHPDREFDRNLVPEIIEGLSRYFRNREKVIGGREGRLQYQFVRSDPRIADMVTREEFARELFFLLDRIGYSIGQVSGCKKSEGDLIAGGNNFGCISWLGGLGVDVYCDGGKQAFCPGDPVDNKTAADWIYQIISLR